MVSHKGQRSGSLLPHDYRIEHRRQDAHTENSDNAGTHKDARTEERQTSAEDTVLGLPGPLNPPIPLGYLTNKAFTEPAAFPAGCRASALGWLRHLIRP